MVLLVRSYTNMSVLGMNFNFVQTLDKFFTMLPISLIVSLEFVKIFQGFFMSKDDDLIKN